MICSLWTPLSTILRNWIHTQKTRISMILFLLSSFLPRFGAFSFIFLDLANLHSKRLSQSPSKKLLTQPLLFHLFCDFRRKSGKISWLTVIRIREIHRMIVNHKKTVIFLRKCPLSLRKRVWASIFVPFWRMVLAPLYCYTFEQRQAKAPTEGQKKALTMLIVQN